MTEKTARGLKILRIVSQALFGGLFVLIFWLSLNPFSHVDNLFLTSDPLIFLTHLTIRPYALILMAILLLLAVALGRVFCGWICPLGGLVDILDALAGSLRRLAGPLRRLLPPSWTNRLASQLTRIPPSFFILGLLVPALFLAPPILQFVHPNIWAVRIISLTPLGLGFLALLVLFSIVTRRLWCKWLCPLGALYGLIGRISIFRLRITRCSGCGSCDGCPMGAADFENRRIASHQCTLCFDFEHRCPVRGFTVSPALKTTAVDQSRRSFLQQAGLIAAGAAAGAAASGSLGILRPGIGRRVDATRSTGKAGPAGASDLLRPPGVVDDREFVQRCLRCLQCVRSCPNGIIHITALEGGPASLFTPHIEFSDYGCDYYCQVCQTVCPNYAIPLQSLAQKQKTPIGRAQIDEKTCVVFRDETNCLVCEEVCPVPGKAISIRDETVIREGVPVLLRYPEMKLQDCIGCGICQVGCPATPAAITVSGDKADGGVGS